MSVEATGWAFRQKVPPKPKVVLLALADQADETTGRVCYGKTDMKHIAAKSSCGERSLYRYIGALVLNGYVIKESGKDKGQASTYWLCLDRLPAKSLKEWQWRVVGGEQSPDDDESEPDTSDDDAQDVEGGSAILADPSSDPDDDQNGRGGLPQGGRHESIADQNINTRAREGIRTSSFSRQAQDAEVEDRTIKKAADRAGAKTFVIEGTRAWNEWIAWRRKNGMIGGLPTCSAEVNGQLKRGWYLPSLFPPSEATGPPTTEPQSLSDQDIHDFK